MDEMSPGTDAATSIRSLAASHGIVYTATSTDQFGHHITRLSGDDVELDEIECLLVALQRAGHLSRREAILLQADYLRQAL